MHFQFLANTPWEAAGDAQVAGSLLGSTRIEFQAPTLEPSLWQHLQSEQQVESLYLDLCLALC